MPDRRHRIAQLCEHWVSGIDDEDAGKVYPMLADLMESGDYVVALSSAMATREMISEYNLNLDAFAPHMERYVLG